MPGYDWRDDRGTVVPSRSGYTASPSGRGPDPTPSRNQDNRSFSINNQNNNEWANEFVNTGITAAYDPNAGSSVHGLKTNQPYVYKTDKQIKEDSTRGAGDKMAADFFGTNYVGLPEGNKAKQQYIYDIYDYGDFGYGPGSQWDNELKEFFGGTPQGGFSHAQLTEYLYSKFLKGEESLGITDEMFLGGNPGQIGYGPGEKPAWYGQPRTDTTTSGEPGPHYGGYGGRSVGGQGGYPIPWIPGIMQGDPQGENRYASLGMNEFMVNVHSPMYANRGGIMNLLGDY